MAANFSVEEVLEMVARDDEMDVDVEEVANEEVTLAERIKECLKEVGDASIDVDFFVDAVSMLAHCTTKVGKELQVYLQKPPRSLTPRFKWVPS